MTPEHLPLLANGESTSWQIHSGLERARKEGKELGRPPTLIPEQEEKCRRIYAEIASLRQLARIMHVSQGTVKRAHSIREP